MYTERKIHGGLFGTVLIVASLIILVAHTRPTWQHSNDLAARVSVLEQEVEKATGTGSKENGSLSEIEQQDLLQAIPEKVEQDSLIVDLNRMMKAADVTVNGLQFSLTQSNGIPAINISGGFQGTSANMLRFLKLVETNPRKLVIKDAGLSRAEVSGGGLDITNLTLSLQAYYQSES